ncbi:hypothetical protein SB754_20015, partial [Leifsonia sp. SIMBA_070]
MRDQSCPAPPSFLEPVELSGAGVILEPLSRTHVPELADAVRDGELWNKWYTRIASPEDMDADVEARLAQH